MTLEKKAQSRILQYLWFITLFLFSSCVTRKAYMELEARRSTMEQELFQKDIHISEIQKTLIEEKNEKYYTHKQYLQSQEAIRKLTWQLDSVRFKMNKIEQELAYLKEEQFLPRSNQRPMQYDSTVPQSYDLSSSDFILRGANKDANSAYYITPGGYTAKGTNEEWTPPVASYTCVIPGSKLFQMFSTYCNTLRVLSDTIANRLHRLGYDYEDRLNYFDLKDGFVIVTDMEQATREGYSIQSKERWATKLAKPKIFTVDFFKQFICARYGYFRVMAVAITKEQMPSSYEPPKTILEMKGISTNGEPISAFSQSSLATNTFTDQYSCKLYMYVFLVKENQEPIYLDKDEAREHLKKSGILEKIFYIRP